MNPRQTRTREQGVGEVREYDNFDALGLAGAGQAAGGERGRVAGDGDRARGARQSRLNAIVHACLRPGACGDRARAAGRSVQRRAVPAQDLGCEAIGYPPARARASSRTISGRSTARSGIACARPDSSPSRARPRRSLVSARPPRRGSMADRRAIPGTSTTRPAAPAAAAAPRSPPAWCRWPMAATAAAPCAFPPPAAASSA